MLEGWKFLPIFVKEKPKLTYKPYINYYAMASDYVSRQHDNEDNGEKICSKAVRAGKRTYFFDVKSTQSDDYYLVITESRRRFNEDGSPNYTRHQMYLYKEDFAKVVDGITEMVDFVKEHKPEYFDKQNHEE
mgnify:CR=1 FL=1